MVHIVRLAMENVVLVGFLSYVLVVAPIIGIMISHQGEKK